LDNQTNPYLAEGAINKGPLLPAFPMFGGKRKVAPVIWKLFGGDIPNYVEPFAGGLAVLLGRENWAGKVETVNEWNPFIVNFYRAVKYDPIGVTQWADEPVFELDLHARHTWLLQQGRGSFKEQIRTDPEYYDTKIAGWWVWGISSWLGDGWCEPRKLDMPGYTELDLLQNPELAEEMESEDNINTSKKSPLLKSKTGVATKKQIPMLNHSMGINGRTITTSKGTPELNLSRGVNRKALTTSKQLPVLKAATGVERYTATVDGLLDYMYQLSARFRNVRVLCGDWSRVCGPSVTDLIGLTGVFLDPPYITASNIYGNGSNKIHKDVIAWCKLHWDNPLLRIALCGYEGESDVPAEWACYKWKAPKGYQAEWNDLKRATECIWYSPACLPLEAPAIQQSLWD